ncbi:MAG: hypothetical protein GXO69_07810 [Acidobacteria bacterium]|nr:hypothetical protein [Acidobacteriota bacterium]
MMEKQKGESRLGCILYILLVIYVVIIGFQVIPLMYNNLQLKQGMGGMEEMAASYNQFRGHMASMKKNLAKKGMDLGLPVTPDSFKIIKRGKNVEISAHYEVEINFLFMKKKISMNPEVSKIVYNF